MTTFRGAVVGADPTTTGPRGRARWRKESVAAMLGGWDRSIRLSLAVGDTDGQALLLVVESGSNLPPAGVCGDVVPERLKLCVRADEISR